LLASSGPAIACPLPASPYENPPATLPAPTPVASVAKDPPGMTTSQLCVRDCGNQFTTCATKCKRSTCVTKCGDLAKSCIGDCLLTWFTFVRMDHRLRVDGRLNRSGRSAAKSM
jgi:hypothetical protein